MTFSLPYFPNTVRSEMKRKENEEDHLLTFQNGEKNKSKCVYILPIGHRNILLNFLLL